MPSIFIGLGQQSYKTQIKGHKNAKQKVDFYLIVDHFELAI